MRDGPGVTAPPTPTKGSPRECGDQSVAQQFMHSRGGLRRSGHTSYLTLKAEWWAHVRKHKRQPQLGDLHHLHWSVVTEAFTNREQLQEQAAVQTLVCKRCLVLGQEQAAGQTWTCSGKSRGGHRDDQRDGAPLL